MKMLYLWRRADGALVTRLAGGEGNRATVAVGVVVVVAAATAGGKTYP